jgi:DNA polymerase III subunit delta
VPPPGQQAEPSGGSGPPVRVPPVTLVVGPEELLVDRAVAQVLRAVRAEEPGADVRDLAASAVEPGALTELTSPSLFGDRTAIVVRGLQDAGDAVLAELKYYVAAPESDVVLVLTHAKGQRGSGVLKAAREGGAREVTCAEVRTRADRLAFLGAEFAAARRRASPEAVETLLEAVGHDLRALAAAAAQLCADTEGTIDARVVRTYYAGRAEVTGFVVADRAVEGRTGEALVQLRYALASGTDPVLVVTALAMALRNLVKVASAPRGLREPELARALGMPAWKIRVVRGQLRGWTAESIAVALPAVAAADAAVKGAAADPLHALERAVVTIARARDGHPAPR